jgi:hypothetical protein
MEAVQLNFVTLLLHRYQLGPAKAAWADSQPGITSTPHSNAAKAGPTLARSWSNTSPCEHLSIWVAKNAVKAGQTIAGAGQTPHRLSSSASTLPKRYAVKAGQTLANAG